MARNSARFARTPPAECGSQSEPAIHHRPTLLVVEDDPAIRRLLEALLGSAGYEVQAVSDGPSALAAIGDAPPAAVFLDVTLPGMSGWDVLAALRARGGAPPVVLLTGDSAALRRGRAAGASAVLLKPFDIDELLALAADLAGPSSD